MSSQSKRTPWLWPLILMIGGIMLLLNNFLLIDLDISPYWAIVPIALGIQLLLRGDIAPSWQTHTFGITRGSVQSASIEIESGELDVQLRALRKPGRLIAGQYTARSRPGLSVRNNHATLRMQRGRTWWLSLADWDVGLANDLAWDVLVSSYLGRLEIDLRGLIIGRAYVTSGLGHVNIACPQHITGPVVARATFGDVRLTIPERSQATITTHTGPFGRVRIDQTRFEEVEPGVYITRPDEDAVDAANPDSPPQQADTTVVVHTVFGSIYIS